MNAPPSLEVLESTHRFPTRYVFKVIGKSDETFAERILEAVNEVLKSPRPATHTVRAAAGGRHAAVTVEIEARTAQQIVDVYRRLMEVPNLVMLL